MMTGTAWGGGRPAGQAARSLAGVLAALCCTACDPGPAGEIDDASPPDSFAANEPVGAPAGGEAPALVDPQIAPAVAGEDGWMYSQAVEADLDGDGAAERVVLTARAEVMRGRPLWDDGQPWQVYVQEASGERTYLYSRFVQLGAVTLRIGLAERERPTTVVLLEHLPDRLAVYEVEYGGPGRTEVVGRLERMLDPTGEVSSPMLP
jgi:hypothetical protein